MVVALIGGPGVGKSTLFEALTRAPHPGKIRGYVSGMGIFALPDPRLDSLARIFRPKKVTPLTFELHDFEGFGRMWKEERAGEILQSLQPYDALLQVVPDFGPFRPQDTFEELHLRLILADLTMVSGRLERIEREKTKIKPNPDEVSALQKLEAVLAEGKPASAVTLTESEERAIVGYRLLTRMPLAVAWNREEDRIGAESDFPALMERVGLPWTEVCAPLERELEELSPREAQELREGYGLSDPLPTRIGQVLLQATDRIVFFTGNEREVRAWSVPRGTPAQKAAGVIHSDMERGFIRAEVIQVPALEKIGSLKEARNQGLLRLEGKDYEVQDGDLLHIRFSV